MNWSKSSGALGLSLICTIDAIEKVSGSAATYYIASVTDAGGRAPDKLIRVGEDGNVVPGIPQDDLQLTNEKIVPQLFRVPRPSIKNQTVTLDDLPDPVKATITADAQSDPVDTTIVHLLPTVSAPPVYLAVINKGTVAQRRGSACAAEPRCPAIADPERRASVRRA